MARGEVLALCRLRKRQMLYRSMGANEARQPHRHRAVNLEEALHPAVGEIDLLLQ